MGARQVNLVFRLIWDAGRLSTGPLRASPRELRRPTQNSVSPQGAADSTSEIQESCEKSMGLLRHRRLSLTIPRRQPCSQLEITLTEFGPEAHTYMHALIMWPRATNNDLILIEKRELLFFLRPRATMHTAGPEALEWERARAASIHVALSPITLLSLLTGPCPFASCDRCKAPASHLLVLHQGPVFTPRCGQIRALSTRTPATAQVVEENPVRGPVLSHAAVGTGPRPKAVQTCSMRHH